MRSRVPTIIPQHFQDTKRVVWTSAKKQGAPKATVFFEHPARDEELCPRLSMGMGPRFRGDDFVTQALLCKMDPASSAGRIRDICVTDAVAVERKSGYTDEKAHKSARLFIVCF